MAARAFISCGKPKRNLPSAFRALDFTYIGEVLGYSTPRHEPAFVAMIGGGIRKLPDGLNYGEMRLSFAHGQFERELLLQCSELVSTASLKIHYPPHPSWPRDGEVHFIEVFVSKRKRGWTFSIVRAPVTAMEAWQP